MTKHNNLYIKNPTNAKLIDTSITYDNIFVDIKYNKFNQDMVLPDNINAYCLDVHSTHIKVLPNYINCSFLNISNTSIKEIPVSTNVIYSLTAQYMLDGFILPQNLYLNHDLYLRGTYINELPKVLNVHGTIVVNFSKVHKQCKVHDGSYIGKVLDCDNRKVYYINGYVFNNKSLHSIIESDIIPKI